MGSEMCIRDSIDAAGRASAAAAGGGGAHTGAPAVAPASLTNDMLMSRPSAVRARLGNDPLVSVRYTEASGDCFYEAAVCALKELGCGARAARPCARAPRGCGGVSPRAAASLLSESSLVWNRALSCLPPRGSHACSMSALARAHRARRSRRTPETLGQA